MVVHEEGSWWAVRALRWEMRRATLDAARVEAVTHGITRPGPVFPPPVARFDLEEMRGVRSRKRSRRAAGEIPGCDVVARIVEGSAARVLIDAAKGAGMLVVGNRGHGGFTEALLSSVSQHCTHHAQCPVVVMRPVAAVSRARCESVEHLRQVSLRRTRVSRTPRGECPR